MNEQIQNIEKAAKDWLRPDNIKLKQAIEQTVDVKLFSFEDIKFQILALREKIEAGQISKWAERNNLSESRNAIGKKVLCLHAGNLPLVGFQDMMATLLSGADYFGKLSSKDPYLLASFLEELANVDLVNTIRYSVSLDNFSAMEADKVLFSGSESSVNEVKNKVFEIGAANEETEFVIRTAKFSIAYLEEENPETLKDLMEAIFRYGGKGCRSVAMVVSPLLLNPIKCHFTDYVEVFWLRNPQLKKPNPKLAYQFAFNKAIERNQAWLDDFLIQESEDFPEDEFTVNWVIGGEEKVRELKTKFGSSVQSVYTSGKKINGLETDFLSEAQKPNLWWKPDGIEVIESILD